MIACPLGCSQLCFTLWYRCGKAPELGQWLLDRVECLPLLSKILIHFKEYTYGWNFTWLLKTPGRGNIPKPEPLRNFWKLQLGYDESEWRTDVSSLSCCSVTPPGAQTHRCWRHRLAQRWLFKDKPQLYSSFSEKYWRWGPCRAGSPLAFPDKVRGQVQGGAEGRGSRRASPAAMRRGHCASWAGQTGHRNPAAPKWNTVFFCLLPCPLRISRSALWQL